MVNDKCNHEWMEIDWIPCWHHVGDGCIEVMLECKKCGKPKETHRELKDN